MGPFGHVSTRAEPLSPRTARALGLQAAAPGRLGADLRQLARCSVRWGIQPASQVLESEGGQCGDPRRPLVEAGNSVEFGAAGFEERSLSFQTDLLQRLEAIGHESRADD